MVAHGYITMLLTHRRAAASRRTAAEQSFDQNSQFGIIDQNTQYATKPRQRNRAKAVAEVSSRDPGQSLISEPGNRLNGVGYSQARPIGVTERSKPRLYQRCDHHKDGAFRHPVAY